LRLDPNWLGRRFNLFEQYCLPSVLAQTTKRFQWLVFFDPNTPAPFCQRIHHYQNCGLFEAEFLPRFDAVHINACIQNRLAQDTQWVITTRLDSDDMIARSFIARSQVLLARKRFCFVNFFHGYQLAGGRVYPVTGVSNPFLSLIEPAGEAKTVMCVPHQQAIKRYPVIQAFDGPMWAQVIHADNLCNELHSVHAIAKRKA
jgi:hypothetical protein